jgi:monovalent cation:H+ antiporter-2, CPA2 family
MFHENPLIAILVIGFVLAFVMGTIANRLRTSLLVGYLLAGVIIGPFTPGFVANQSLALQLADIGVILLMFGVGLHFSVKDLLAVRTIAVPGALLQVTATTLVGAVLGRAFGWSWGAAGLFGFALSIASTVVLLRSFQERRLIESDRGRVAVGWLVTQDIITVLALVVLPVLPSLFGGSASSHPSLAQIGMTIVITLGKVAAFVALMLIVGRRVIPALLHYVAHTGSRELFRLAVLALALGVAFAASTIFGVSFALGAFLAGVVLSESQLSQRAAEETLPLRDAFAALFFISVGMLFDPMILLTHPLPLLGALAVVLIVTPLIAFFILRILKQSLNDALTIAAGLGQIGEFSFILAALGVQLGVLDEGGRELILGTSILSIILNPMLFFALKRAAPWIARSDTRAAHPAVGAGLPPAVEYPMTSLSDHVVLVGFGRVGQLVGETLLAEGQRLLVVEAGDSAAQKLRDRGVEVILGNAVNPALLTSTNLAEARLLIVAIPEVFEAGQIVRQARAISPLLRIIARAHFDTAVAHLTQYGATSVIMGEREIAKAMLDYAEASPAYEVLSAS